MRPRRLAAIAAALLTGLATLASAAPPASAAYPTEWQNGATESDQMINCQTGQLSVGMSADTGWGSVNGQVPKVGEKFYLHGSIALIGNSCSGRALAIPEIVAPDGITYVAEPLLWGIHDLGQPGTLTDAELEIVMGVHGPTFNLPGEEPFVLERGEVLEFMFPVKATRQMKGTGTRAPTCTTRRDGDGPCPRAESGDHLQMVFMVGGHGGNKQYITPYVPLFVAPAGSGDTKAPQTRISGGPANGAIATSTAARFTLGSSEGGSRMRCTLDGRARSCAPGALALNGLAPGTHVLRAQATDAAGNTDRSGATRVWTVPVPASGLKAGKGFKAKANPGAFGGRALAARKKGATVTTSVKGARRVALVAGPSKGSVKVYAGKRLLRTVSLKGGGSRRVVPVASFGSAYTGTIRVVTTSGKTVQIEGIAAPTR